MRFLVTLCLALAVALVAIAPAQASHVVSGLTVVGGQSGHYHNVNNQIIFVPTNAALLGQSYGYGQNYSLPIVSNAPGYGTCGATAAPIVNLVPSYGQSYGYVQQFNPFFSRFDRAIVIGGRTFR